MRPAMLEIAFLADQRLPIYQRLKDALAARIAKGEWKPGEAIPPESQLAEEHQVAVGTMRKAIEGLVLDGLVERRQGLLGTDVRLAVISAMRSSASSAS